MNFWKQTNWKYESEGCNLHFEIMKKEGKTDVSRPYKLGKYLTWKCCNSLSDTEIVVKQALRIQVYVP